MINCCTSRIVDLNRKKSAWTEAQEELEKEKNRVYREERVKNDEEKRDIEKQKEYLACEFSKLDEYSDELNRRDEEIQAMFMELEQKREDIREQADTLNVSQIEIKDKLLITREFDIKRLIGELSAYKTDQVRKISRVMKTFHLSRILYKAKNSKLRRRKKNSKISQKSCRVYMRNLKSKETRALPNWNRS